MRLESPTIYLHTNKGLYDAIISIRSFLHESISQPTKYKQLVLGHPHFSGIDDAFGLRVGGVAFGGHE